MLQKVLEVEDTKNTKEWKLIIRNSDPLNCEKLNKKKKKKKNCEYTSEASKSTFGIHLIESRHTVIGVNERVRPIYIVSKCKKLDFLEYTEIFKHKPMDNLLNDQYQLFN